MEKLIRKILKEESERYMFFSNLEQMRRQCGLLLDLDQDIVEKILSNGHDWAQDHIAEAKNNIDQVFDFLMNETKKQEFGPTEDDMMYETEDFEDLALADEADGMDPNQALAMSMMEGRKKKKNTPTNPSLWKKSLSWARARYKVCPSAYCNGAAAKHYKSLGGKWTKK